MVEQLLKGNWANFLFFKNPQFLSFFKNQGGARSFGFSPISKKILKKLTKNQKRNFYFFGKVVGKTNPRKNFSGKRKTNLKGGGGVLKEF